MLQEEAVEDPQYGLHLRLIVVASSQEVRMGLLRLPREPNGVPCTGGTVVLPGPVREAHGDIWRRLVCKRHQLLFCGTGAILIGVESA